VILAWIRQTKGRPFCGPPFPSIPARIRVYLHGYTTVISTLIQLHCTVCNAKLRGNLAHSCHRPVDRISRALVNRLRSHVCTRIFGKYRLRVMGCRSNYVPARPVYPR
jgi:hypothetical protein